MYKLLLLATSVASLCFVPQSRAQAPTLGNVSSFALFSSNGNVNNTGLSHLTGNVGTHNGAISNFGNVDGVLHDTNSTSADAANSLTITCIEIHETTSDFFPGPELGNGQILQAGTYFIGESTLLNNILTLDGEENPEAVFIFQIQSPFSSTEGAQVALINGAQACNVFWLVYGTINLAENTIMKGTLIGYDSSIVLNNGVEIEGRAVSTNGTITATGVTVRIPLGCGVPQLTGPPAPPLNTVVCYTLFSGNGQVTNTGDSILTGDVGTNNGATTGFQTENVTGTIHESPDASTAQCHTDLNTVYSYINSIPIDILLHQPSALGNDLVLTPHAYHMSSTVLTGKLTLNAQGNPDAVFIIKVNGTLTTATDAVIELINGAQAKNLFWRVNSTITLNENTSFKGTLISNNGAITLHPGVEIEGRVMNRSGGITTNNITAAITPGCELLGITATTQDKTAKLYPNPFSSVLTIDLAEVDVATSNLTIYNSLGVLVFTATLQQNYTELPMNLPTGIYYYRVATADGTVQTGKLVSKQ